MNEEAKRKLRLSIIGVNDLLILSLAMLESGFWSKTIDKNLTWNNVMPFQLRAAEEVQRLDPFSTSFDSTFPILEGNNLQEVLTTFGAGLLIFFIVKIVLALLFSKFKCFDDMYPDHIEVKELVKT